MMIVLFFFQAEDGIRFYKVTGVQTCALPISLELRGRLADIALFSGETALNTTSTVNAFEALN